MAKLPSPSADPEFNKVLNDAVEDFIKNGFWSSDRLQYWLSRLRGALELSLTSPRRMEKLLREALATIWQKQVENGGILQWHPGVERFTIEKLKPKLREHLDRRIRASADLIKLNRDEQIEATLRRFAGWATSVPEGGAAEPEKAETKKQVKRGIAGLPFTERRVIIDQGHKFISAINDIIATDAGAIAGKWHSHWRQPGYNYRPDHKERDEKIYLIRDSWAREAGFVKPGPDGYTDDITQPGEEIYCRCFYEFIYSPSDLPPEMLTAKGKTSLAAARATLA